MSGATADAVDLSRRRGTPYPWLKPAVFVGACVPAVVLALDVRSGAIGADPVVASIHQLGRLSVLFLLAALACTPARLVFGWTWPARIRRMLGLFGYAYAFVHALIYDVYVNGGTFAENVAAYVEDVTERPFILVGSAAAILLFPLVLTSTNGMVRRLGHANWQRLHRLAYVATVLAVVHFIWAQKADTAEPFVYAAVLFVLLAIRVVYRKPAKRKSP